MTSLTALTILIASQTAPLAITGTKTLVGVRVVALAAAPTGNRIAVATEDNQIRIIDAATRTTIKTLTGHPQPARALAWSHDGSMLASGDDSARIFIWKTATWTKAVEGRPHTKAIQALTFNKAGTLLLSTGNDDRVLVFPVGSLKKPNVEYLGRGMNLYGAKFFPNSNAIGVGTLSNGAKTFDAKGNLLMTYVGHDNQGSLDADFNSNGTWLVSAGRDNRVGLFEMKTAKRIGYYKGHTDWVTSAQFTPNGKYVVSASSDRTVNIWNPYNFATVASIADSSMIGSPIAITGSGMYLATADSADNLRIHTLSQSVAAVATKATPTKAPVKKKKG